MQKDYSSNGLSADTESTETPLEASSTPAANAETESDRAGQPSLEALQWKVEMKQAMLDLAKTGRLSRLARKRANSRRET